ncbi:hypothetical protein TheetDRAFT_3040 [Thermoanaerobacter ethanolicus JW 200]|nr:hypothetical protein TheetDRAFT_3040 [Thermoanaerobacter ethanolicus JW 200]
MFFNRGSRIHRDKLTEDNAHIFEDIDLVLKDRGQIIMRELINKKAESPIRRKRFKDVKATKMSNDKIIAEII